MADSLHAFRKDSTDVTLYPLIKNSSVTTGAGLTGLVYNTANLTAYYVRTGGTATAITLANQSIAGAHTDGGFVEVDATNMPGLYRLDLPDAAVATGVRTVTVVLKGAANMRTYTAEIQLEALPSDLTHIAGTSASSPATAGILDVNVKNINNTTAATPGASGGVLISGSNSGTTTLGALTVTGATTLTGAVSAAAGVAITQSASNTAGLSITGNGTGSAVRLTAGATGHGAHLSGGSTSGRGVYVTTVDGDGVLIDAGGADKTGLHCQADFVAAWFEASAAGGFGMSLYGKGDGGVGLEILGGEGTGGTAAHGITITAGTSGADGISITAGSTSGDGINIQTTSGHGVDIEANGTGKDGLRVDSALSYGVLADGAIAGIRTSGSTTGAGIIASGGSTSGDGIQVTATDGDAINVTGAGSGKYDIRMGGTGTILGGLTGAVGSVTTVSAGAITASSLASDTITAAKIASDAITAAKIATDAITAAKIAADAIGSSELAATAANEIAETLLMYDMSSSSLSSASSRSPLNSLRALRNRFAIASGTLTVYKEDDSTSAWTSVITTSASASPIIESNPD